MHPHLFFNLCILSSGTTALSTLCQGRLYSHIRLYIYINYVYLFFSYQKGVDRTESTTAAVKFPNSLFQLRTSFFAAHLFRCIM